MLDFSFSIESDVEEALERFEEAISELDGMTFEVEAERAEGVPVPSGPGEHQDGDTVTVNEVRSNIPVLGPFGHSTISVDHDTPVGLEPDSELAAYAAGFEEVLAFGIPHPVPGHIEPDQGAAKDHATIRITAQQAAEIRAFIKQAEAQPQTYDFLYENCAEWVEEVLHAAWIGAPRDITPGSLVDYLRKRYPQR